MALLVGTALFAIAWLAARACVQSVTIDEADSYLAFARPDWPAHWYPAAANHVLNTVLVRLSTRLFGLAHLTLRLPALIGAVIFVICCLRFCIRMAAPAWVRWVLLLCLTYNPLVMDHLVAARGYSLALALLMTAVLMAAGCLLSDEPGEETRLYRRAAVASACAALSFSANFSFAFVNAAVMALFLAWTWRRAAYRGRLAAAGLLPGFAVVLVICSSVLWKWPKGELAYGAHSLAEMWDGLVASSFFELNENLVNPLLLDGLRYVQPALPAALLAVCAARIFVILRTRRAWLHTTGRRPERMVFYLGAVLAICLLLHWLALHFWNLPLPLNRTAVFFVPLFLLLMGFAIVVPGRSRWSVATRVAGMTVLSLGAFFFLGCLRLSYFREWKFDADTAPAYRMLDQLCRSEGIHEVPVEWRYLSSLNFYRVMYHGETSLSFAAPAATFPETNRYPENRQVYVLFWPVDEAFARSQQLEIVFRGTRSDLVIARRARSDLQKQLAPVHPEKHQPIGK
jgi:hypothetical protein